MVKTKETLVINLMGGPCSGKSTIASGLFYNLKKLGYNCELALEFAKDKVWEESLKVLDDQFYIFGKQFHKIFRLNGKVDVIITDSPLIMSLYYNKMPSKYFNDFVVEQFNQFNNLTFFIERNDNAYEESGRIQTKEEAEQIDKDIKNLMSLYYIKFHTLSCEIAVDEITEIIKNIKTT